MYRIVSWAEKPFTNGYHDITLKSASRARNTVAHKPTSGLTNHASMTSSTTIIARAKGFGAVAWAIKANTTVTPSSPTAKITPSDP